MIEAAHETDATVKSGAQVVRELKEQAQNVEEASNITVDVYKRQGFQNLQHFFRLLLVVLASDLTSIGKISFSL